MSLVLNNTILLDGIENYQQIGNSRMGGKPDLPIGMDYPVFDNGFYEFITQINLNQFKILGLPDNGLISLFFGNIRENEAIGYYFDENIKLELKEIPEHCEFAGAADFREHISHKVRVEKVKIPPRSENLEYNNPQFSEEDNISHWKMDFLNESSYILQKAHRDKNNFYLMMNNFNRIADRYGIRFDFQNNSIKYLGRDSNLDYKNIDDLLNCEMTLSFLDNEFNGGRQIWLEQLKKFEKEKEFHLKRVQDYTCILSLAESLETRMVWGDLYKLELFGQASEFMSKNIFNLDSSIMK